MSASFFGRYTSGICATAAVLAGCSGSQPIVAPGAMTQSRTIAEQANHSGSWMLPEAKGRDLLYISSSTYQYSDVYVYTFPGAKLVGGIVVGNYASGLCSNGRGDVSLPTATTFINTGTLKRDGLL